SHAEVWLDTVECGIVCHPSLEGVAMRGAAASPDALSRLAYISPMPSRAPASADEFESVLRRHVLAAWFPRCLDQEHGGFLCDFDRAWRPNGPHDKLLEFQARQTLTAAEAARAYPEDAGLREATLHGFRYLRDVLWDRDAGGWFHLLTRNGTPKASATKHAHGAAYAIEACVAVHHATGEPTALDLAREAFGWLDRYARDQQHGGYFGFLTRDGTVIRDPSQWSSNVDTIGTELGLKDANVHSDLLETFVHLYRAWPDPTVAARLAEMLDIMSDRMVVPQTGALHIFVTPDWRPIPHMARAAYQCQTAYRISIARDVVGDDGRLSGLACRMVDHALRYQRDRRGGFFYGGAGSEPRELQGSELQVRPRIWWVQVEALKALLAMAQLAPERSDYRDAFEVQWQYIRTHFLDERYGGFFSSDIDGRRLRRLRLLATPAATMKGDMWKDASHDGRALLYCMQTLRARERGGGAGSC
ncbi:MAG: AGE family epimerase/isomerase, partial [Gemmatimonadales bacterium]